MWLKIGGFFEVCVCGGGVFFGRVMEGLLSWEGVILFYRDIYFGRERYIGVI